MSWRVSWLHLDDVVQHNLQDQKKIPLLYQSQLWELLLLLCRLDQDGCVSGGAPTPAQHRCGEGEWVGNQPNPTSISGERRDPVLSLQSFSALLTLRGPTPLGIPSQSLWSSSFRKTLTKALVRGSETRLLRS